jgi:hypothetical protein
MFLVVPPDKEGLAQFKKLPIVYNKSLIKE